MCFDAICIEKYAVYFHNSHSVVLSLLVFSRRCATGLSVIDDFNAETNLKTEKKKKKLTLLP